MRKYSPYPLLLALAISVIPMSVHGAKMAYVTNTLAETLSKVNLEAMVVENDIVLLGGAPNQVLLQDSLGYVVNSGSNDIQVIDLAGDSTLGYIPLLPSANPYKMVIVDDTLAYVTNWSLNSVSKVNLLSQELIAEIPAGTAPEAIIAVGGLLYVANCGYSYPAGYEQGTVSVINAEDDIVIATVEVGTNPQDLAFDPQGEINVVCTGDYVESFGMIYVIDPRSFTVTDSMPLGGSPGTIAISSKGIGYLGAGGWVSEGYVYQVNLLTNQVMRDADNPIITDPGAMGMAVDDAGDIFCCCFVSNTLVWLVSPDSTFARFDLSSGPNAVALSEDHLVYAELIPDAQEVEPGGELGYTIEIVNQTDETLTIELVAGVILPNGHPYKGNPVAGPQDITLQPHQERTIHITHTTPGSAPAGRYVYFVRTTVPSEDDILIRSFWFDIVADL